MNGSMSSCTFKANTVKSRSVSFVMPKNPTICSGNRCTSDHSTTPMAVAPKMPYHSVFFTRSNRCAPKLKPSSG